MPTKPSDSLAELSLGERAAIGRIEKALFGGDGLVRVGRYEIRGLLGSGAFGKVYRAHDPELHREVALKVMEAVFGAEDRDELLREARVTATINHPNVATVHDAGVIVDDQRVRVFIAMELVVGQNLRDWLAAQRRAIDVIVDVMRQAGRGLAAAHAAGIVHRDFKPDNILVGHDGRARVVDFGLSHAHGSVLDADDGVAERLTTASVVGTPAYMAPEQFAGAPASTLTDQFAYCITLWEAVHGVRPFRGATLHELRDALERPLVPPRPRRLGRAIQRALDRGLDREPEARFPSIDALVAALDRRRFRWIVPATFATIGGLAAGAGAFALHARSTPDPCPRPIDELTGVWSDARRSAIGAAFRATGPRGEATFGKLAPTIDRAAEAWLDARRDACEATAVRHVQSPDLLDRRIACLQDWRRQLAAVTKAFETATPELASRATSAIEDLPPLQRCADGDALTAAPALPTDPALRVRIEALAERLAELRGLHVAGRQRDATALVEQIAREAESVGYAPISLSVELWQAEALTVAGKLDDARARARQAFDLALAISDRRSAVMAAADVAFLGAYDPTRAADSLQWVHTGQALLAKLEGELELDAKLANAEANIELAVGVPSAAQAAAERAIADFRKLNPEHTNLGTNLALLGSAELDQGRLDAADRDLREAAARLERDLGPDHPEVASTLINLALVESGRGVYADAIRTLDRALELQQRVLGPDHPNLAYAYLGRAGALEARGDRERAERDFVAADRIVRASYGATHPLVATIAIAYSELLSNAGRGAEAVARATEAVAILGTSDVLTAALAEATLARALAADGREPIALEHARAAAGHAGSVPTGPGAVRGIIYQALGDIALARHADGDANTALRASVAALSTGAPDPARLAQVRFTLSRALAGTDRPSAVATARDALHGFPRDGDPVLRAAITTWLDANTR